MLERVHGAPTAETERLPSVRVVEAVAEAKAVDPLDLDPLFDHVDPDALDALVEGGSGELVVNWTLGGLEITVTGDGSVDIH